MSIALKIMNGPKSNQVVPIKAGLTIGRSADMVLAFDDAKMSSKHVQFTLTAQGWVVSDLGSKNGFRFNSAKTKKTVIVPGSYLKIGDTEFQVIELETPPEAPTKTSKKTITTKAPVPEASVTGMTLPPIEEATPRAVAPVKIERIDWPEYFAQFVQMSAEKVKSRPREVAPFRRAVQLNIMKGLQSETVWTLGYGPREVGPHSVDLVIEDPGAPPICFSVYEKNDDIYFVTDRPDVVLLNNASVKTDTLEDGDLISFASTTIKFSFIE